MTHPLTALERAYADWRRSTLCRFCGQAAVHHCPGGELRPGDRDFDLYGDKRAFPGVRDAADHVADTLLLPEERLEPAECRICGGLDVHECPGGRVPPRCHHQQDPSSFTLGTDWCTTMITAGLVDAAAFPVCKKCPRPYMPAWDQSDSVVCSACDEDGTLCSCIDWDDEEEKLP